MLATHPRFADALRAIDAGDLNTLRGLLSEHPEVVTARATSLEPPYEGYFHGATLLHHVAGNPIRGELPANAADAARLLMMAGADPDATCGGGPSQPDTGGGTVLGLVASGAQAHVQGLTAALVDALFEGGAAWDPDGGLFASLYHTVEHQGQRDVARLLRARGARADLPTAAGLGELDTVRDFLDADGMPRPGSDDIWRKDRGHGLSGPAEPDDVLADALLAASVNGWPEVVDFLIGTGAPVDRFRPWGPFMITALHGAAWAGWVEAVRVLVAGGADPSLREVTFDSTPLQWARHCDRHEVAELLAHVTPEG